MLQKTRTTSFPANPPMQFVHPDRCNQVNCLCEQIKFIQSVLKNKGLSFEVQL